MIKLIGDALVTLDNSTMLGNKKCDYNDSLIFKSMKNLVGRKEGLG